MKYSSAKQHPLNTPYYKTWDGVYMLGGDEMWRVCNPYGHFLSMPIKVIFQHDNKYTNEIHFFGKLEALEFLNHLDKRFPSPELINHYISFYKHQEKDKEDRFWCPCSLGKPFYPDKDCQCGG